MHADSEEAVTLVASEEAVAQVASEDAVAQVFRPAHTDETVRYVDVGDPPAAEQPPEALMDPYQPEPVLAAERLRSLVWPLALALIVGLGLGFGGGYAVGMRDRPRRRWPLFRHRLPSRRPGSPGKNGLKALSRRPDPGPLRPTRRPQTDRIALSRQGRTPRPDGS